MRVDVIMNSKAGYMNRSVIQQKVQQVLFRCDLHFHIPSSIEEMRQTILDCVELGTEFFMICGGDGTLNACLSPLIKLRSQGIPTPPICIISSGTANDLASEMGISNRIEEAARAILEGGVKLVDVIEIQAQGKTSYMITNGGMGIPAQTARRANVLRAWIKKQAAKSDSLFLKTAYGLGKKVIEAAGPKIYELLLVGDVTSWSTDRWEVSIDIPGKAEITTRAPFIMINNQPKIGGKFAPAPFTSNSDGTFNVLLINPTQLLPQVKAILDIRMGKVPDIGTCPSFETPSLRIRAKENSRLTFFGDGEILHRNTQELTLRCIHPGIPVVTMRAAE